MILQAQAHAKVNLHLEVLRKREDGYHEVETILQTIELCDRLTFHPTKGAIHVRCSHPDVPEDRTNLCHRAATALRGRLGIRAGVEIRIDKRIPVAAGLGGGSSDAAATLLALLRLWEKEMEDDELLRLAADLGADVPFFLAGGTQLGRGTGAELTPLHSSGGGFYLLLSPDQKLSTAAVYEGLKMGLTHHAPKVNLQNYKALLSRFPDRGWPGFNRLSDCVYPAYPRLHRLYLQLQETRPQVAMLSGSGPSLYAVYSTLAAAEEAQRDLAPDVAYTWIGRSTRHGVALREVEEP